MNQTQRVITWIFIVLTVGFLRLIFYWKPEWYLRCTHSPCSLRDADTVLLRVSNVRQSYMTQRVFERVKESSISEISASLSNLAPGPQQVGYSPSQKYFGRTIVIARNFSTQTHEAILFISSTAAQLRAHLIN